MNLDDDTIRRIIDDYRSPHVTTRDIVVRHAISKETLMEVVRTHGISRRGNGRRLGSWLRPPRVATKPGEGYSVDAELENAKLKLRQRGYIVYGAEVTGGRKAKGLFRIDHRLVSREELLEAAR